ncbi:hypothetical protein COLO4_38495 [Corchorus olitorius]|uniref:Uncharacterized protein n=1 Tax=Corchorus olitorius TaxID=93759 RepID=A0A1R3FUP0_9ROSI|nr:hypothetical protein COLO4_38495 [Corchorus olitorius]
MPVTQTVHTKATQPIISHSTNAVGNSFTPGPVVSLVDNIATPNNEQRKESRRQPGEVDYGYKEVDKESEEFGSTTK